jgi:hypothetical protein
MGDLTIAQSLTNMANAGAMMPIYTAGGNSAMYSRPVSTSQYTQLDTKSMYPSTWTVPYQEDTSPIDAYPTDQTTAYLPEHMGTANASMYGSTYRWPRTIPKPMHPGAPAYVEESPYPANSRSYIQASLQSIAASEPLSPLNMTSLQMTLPERPMRQPRFVESTVPQRQLPIPQPSPAMTSRNVVDQMQDQRLRSFQAINVSSPDAKPSFIRPLLPWSINDARQVGASDVMSTGAAIQTSAPTDIPTTVEGGSEYMSATTTIADEGSATSAASKIPLSFSTSGLFDTMSVSAPTPNYSNFREYRIPSTSSAHMARQSSQNSLYSYSTDGVAKRKSLQEESSTDNTLVSGHRYTPLSHAQPRSSSGASNFDRDPFQSRDVSLHRASMSEITSDY